MSNISINSPQGFQLWGTLSSSTETGKLVTYEVLPPVNYVVLNAAFTGIYSGDFVRLGAATDNNPGYLYPCNPGEPGIGVFQGCYYKDIQGNAVYSRYLLNGTQTFVVSGNPTPIYCLIVNDPNAVFNVQASFSGPAVVSSNVPLGVTQSQIGLNANLGIGGAFTDVVPGTTPYISNPANGSARGSLLSAEYLDIASISGNPNAQFKINDFTPYIGGTNPPYATPNGAGFGNGQQGAFNDVLVSLNNSVLKNGLAQNYGYFTTAVNIPQANFTAMNSTAGSGVTLTNGVVPGIIFIPLSVVITMTIPVTPTGVQWTQGSPLVVTYANAVPTAANSATLTAPASSILSIIPTALVPGTGSVYIPLLKTALSNGFMTANADQELFLNVTGLPFLNPNPATVVTTAYVSWIAFPA